MTVARQARPLTVALVDDAPEVRAMLHTVLSRDQRLQVVDSGEDGLQAVRMAEQRKPDVLVLDVSMPRLDGLAAARRIRCVAPATCIVLYTARDDPGLDEQANRAMVDAVISKGAPLSTLADGLVDIHARFIAANQQSNSPSLVDFEQTERRFQLLIDAVEDYAIFMLDRAGLIVTWNAGAQRIKGYRADEIVGQHFRVFYPEDKQLSGYPEYELLQAMEHGHFEEEGWRVRKDGSMMWASVLITAVHDPTGEHIGFAKVTRDITERRKIQQERDRHAADLAELNAELARANASLADADAQRAEFLAVTAHELRTPLRVITGSAEVLSKLWSDLGADEREQLLGTLSSSASRLERLLSDLLVAAKLEAGGVELTTSVVSLRSILTKSVTAAKALYASDPPTLHAPLDLLVIADPDRLAQAVDNLIQNAYRHGRPPVRISLRRRGETAEIRVSDAGRGIPLTDRERLFRRYVTTGSHRSTGLGLFIVRELARAHGGEACYREADQDVAGFVLTLPLSQKQRADDN